MDYRICSILSCIIFIFWIQSTGATECGRINLHGIYDSSRELHLNDGYDGSGSSFKWGFNYLSESGRLLDSNRDSNEYTYEQSSSTRKCRISKYISYDEAVKSVTAKKYNISNTPSEYQLLVMKNAGVKFFDPLREHFNRPIYISSFYRSPELNKRIKGSGTSHHMILEDICAIDIDQDGILQGPSNLELFHYIKDNLEFYVLIWEFGDTSPQWVHIAYSLNPKDNQVKRVYKAQKLNNLTIYTRI